MSEEYEEANIAELRVNDAIRAKEVRVVAPDGSQVGVKSLDEAKWLAEQLGLDLVEVAPTAKPPVTRLMDYGKYKYELSVKEREARKSQTRSTVKEITFRVKISDHDFKIKSDRAKRFLENGDKVRVRIWFRGREASRPTLGSSILDRLTEDLVDIGKVDQEPKQEGRNMTMTFSPAKKPRRKGKGKAKKAEEETETQEAVTIDNASEDTGPTDTVPETETVAEAGPETDPVAEAGPEDAAKDVPEDSSQD